MPLGTSLKMNRKMRHLLLSISITFSSFSYSDEDKKKLTWEEKRNPEWEAQCETEHPARQDAEFYLIQSMLKSACANRLYGERPMDQHLGTCMLARLTLAVTEQDVMDAVHYCRTTNGWD